MVCFHFCRNTSLHPRAPIIRVKHPLLYPLFPFPALYFISPFHHWSLPPPPTCRSFPKSFPSTIFSYPHPPLLSTWMAQFLFLVFYRFFFTTPPLFLPSPHLTHILTLPLPPRIMLHPLTIGLPFKDRTIWPGFSSLLLYRHIDCISAPIGKIPSTNICEDHVGCFL